MKRALICLIKKFKKNKTAGQILTNIYWTTMNESKFDFCI